MKVLTIEDDDLIVKVLQRALAPTYRVEVAETGSQGMHQAEVNDYDAILLDLNLPDMHGLEVCQYLREHKVATPILVLSGQSSVDDKVRLLDAGADDYLTKPFSLEELKARLRTLLRRGLEGSQSSSLRVGDLVLNTAARWVKRANQTIQLRRKEFELLEYLMHHAGTVVTRESIIDHVWDASDVMWTNAVDVHIKHLRDKIDRPFGQPMIMTVYGVGYKLEAAAPEPNGVAPHRSYDPVAS